MAMELESRKVFIDTQSFVKMGLNFNHPALESFLELCKEKKLLHLTTTVVKREVESKIQSSIQEALSSLQGFRRKARLLENIDDESIKALFNDIDEDEVHKKAISVYEEFLAESNSNILNASSVNAEDVLELYFGKKPPFGEGKKKSEFPDAISLFSVLNEIGDEKAYVISDDSDLKEFCSSSKNLISIDTLDKFLDLYNEYESAITDLVKKYLSSIDGDIKNKIEEQITDAWAYNEAPWEDSEVEEFNVLQVHDFEPTVVWVNEEECLITFDVDVDIEYIVTGPDFNGGIYDKEDGRIYTFGTTTHSGAATNTFTMELGFSYELEDGELKDIDETEFYVAGLSDGVAVYMDENGDDW
ncbi:PIN domain-containing protein [Thalassolituus pacificus]|uniref:PIN domain-containing protein n=1 Tax=Thalassolituus pacificus TaxID=2975440 RepID=A0A9X2WJ27_9GAMM|nr:PIN domain-containing protein [Thalassolituus pacificus]MCT7361091.1 PIN domain-containing protein [Thalassolituus pacificus]